MDNITHTLAGLALARAGLARRTRFATTALVLGSNLPDADLIALLRGPLAFIDAHRGISHSLVGGCTLGVLLGIGLWGLGRFVPPRHVPGQAPWEDARLGPLVGLALLAVLLHLGFDCLNDYGIRLLLPFTGRWYYGDIIFIVDPWFWLLLGAGVHLTVRRRWPVEPLAWAGWAVLSIPILTDATPPMPARMLWLLGLGMLGVLRYLGRPPSAFWPRAAFAALGLYVLAVAGLHARALGNAEAAIRAQEAGPVARLAAIPRPADPFHWNVLYETQGQVVTGWIGVGGGAPAITEEHRYRENLDDPMVRNLIQNDPQGRVASHFCRYLFADIVPEPWGATVSFRDARFAVRGRHEFSVFTVHVVD